jgi:hypothetical protein
MLFLATLPQAFLIGDNPMQEPFNPTMAIARYRELEALLNLELLKNLEWQERRARGDTSFLLDSPYFAEQNRLMEEVERHGYSIVDYEDDETGDTIYALLLRCHVTPRFP